MIVLSANKDGFISSFSVCIPFTSFSCSYVPSLISDISNLCSLSLLCLAIGLSKSQILILLVFYLDFPFSVLLVHILIFIISFLLLMLDLIYSFSSFLRSKFRLFSSFKKYVFNAIYFPLSTILPTSYKFW